jgi:hypothetical protein
MSDRLAKALSGAAACGLSEDTLQEHIQWIALTLPSEPAAAGAQWSRRVERPIPGFAFETREFVYLYRGPSAGPHPGSQVIDVKTKLEIKADPQSIYRIELRYKSQDGRGTISFDSTAGYLLGMDFTQKTELGMTMLGKESVAPRQEHIKVILRR